MSARPLAEMSWTELGGKVRILATELRRLGVKPGDRVAAYLPNIPEAMMAMLATTSIGAIWSSCGPDFGPRGVLDRFTQLTPKVLFCVDGYQYAGKPFDRRPDVREFLKQLKAIEHVVYLPYLDREDREPLSGNTIFWNDLLNRPPVPAGEFKFEQVPFKHPLWILFSSGTTGLPKAIVHGHGSMIIEQLKALHFHMDLHSRERMFFYTSTGWMMWNYVVSSLLGDVVPVLYDGNPAWPQPDLLWKMVEDSGTNFFGASPTYQAILEKSGIVPKDRFEFSKLRTIILAGSPVTPECQAWFFENVKDCWVQSGSGGTDVCTGMVGGVVTLPVYAGEIQARCLGVSVFAFNEHGESVVDEVGELVITEPMPSMPVAFWNDEDNKRYFESYFQEYPGIWRHGDFFRINKRGGCFVLGRSDATLNRYGVRIGTAEIYRTLAESARRRGCTDRESRFAGREVLHAPVRQARGRPEARRACGRYDPREAAQRVLTPSRAGQDLPGRLDPAHADGQEDGGSGAAHPHGCAAGEGGEPRCGSESSSARLFRSVREDTERLLTSIARAAAEARPHEPGDDDGRSSVADWRP